MKRGSRSLPSEKIILDTKVFVDVPMYSNNSKKYINFKMNRAALGVIKRAHDDVSDALVTKNVQIPLEGDVLKVKIPWRGRFPICSVVGAKQLSSLAAGDQVGIKVEFCGAWIISDFSGVSWKLMSLAS